MHSPAQNNIARFYRVFSIAVSTVLLTGCDAVFDCLDKDGPTFDTTTLLPAVLNQEYTDSIFVSVENEPFDDRFDYNFTLLSGNFPMGITAQATGRTLVLSGTATELGNHQFRINVTVDDGLTDAQSGLCFRVRDREFSLLVEQENG